MWGETKTVQQQLRCIVISADEDARECCWNDQSLRGLNWEMISELCDEDEAHNSISSIGLIQFLDGLEE